MIHDLAKDISAFLDASPGSFERSSAIALVYEALQRDSSFLSTHPTCLLQSLWNSCFWHGHPDFIEHYDPPRELVNTSWPPHESYPSLHEQCQVWLKDASNSGVNAPWVTSSRPPVDYLGFGSHAILRGHQSLVHSVAFSPDDEHLATASSDGVVILWHVATRSILRTLPHPESVNSLSFLNDGSTLATASGDYYTHKDCRLRLWDIHTGALVFESASQPTPINSLAVSPCQRLIATAGGSSGDKQYDTAIKLWNTTTGTVSELVGHTKRIESVCFSVDGAYLISGAIDDSVRMWCLSKRREITRIADISATEVAYSPVGDIVAFSSQDGSVTIVHLISGKRLRCHHRRFATCVAFSPDGRVLASGSYDRSVRLWNPYTGEAVASFVGHDQVLWDVAFSCDGKLVASGGGHEDHTVRLWQTASKKSPPRLKGNKGRIRNLVVAPGGQHYATSSTGSGFGGESNDNSIRLWGVDSGKQEAVFRDGHEWWIECVHFLSTESLVSGSRHPTIRCWDIPTRRTLFTLDRAGATAHALAISPDRNVLAAVLADDDIMGRNQPSIVLWDLRFRRVTLAIPLEAGSHLNAIAFSPDGNRLFGALGEDVGINGVFRDSKRNGVCAWDTRTGACLLNIDDHKDSVSAIAMSPTGLQVVSGSWDGAVIIRDGQSLLPRQVLRHFADRVEYLAYSRCGTFLYAGTKYDLVAWRTTDWHSVYDVNVANEGTRWTIGNNESLWLPSPLEHPKNIGDVGDRFVGSRGYHAMCVKLHGATH